jgi:hypothetical protein
LKANAEGRAKKVYQKPMLRVYGDIQTMTQSRDFKAGKQDGGILFGMNLKTS